MKKINVNIDMNLIPTVHRPLYINSDNKLIVSYGGGGSGKTYNTINAIIYRALKETHNVLVCRKFQSTIKKTTWKEFKNRLSSFGILDLCIKNETDRTLIFPNGSYFAFVGLDNIEKIKGLVGDSNTKNIDQGFSIVFIDEATEINPDDLDGVMLRTRSEKKQQFFLCYNPISKVNWCYKRFHSLEKSEEQKNNDNALILHSTYLDNWYISEGLKQTLEAYKTSNPEYYEIYCLGKFANLGKTIFNNYEIKKLDIDELKQDEELEFRAGLDFGYNDPNALVCCYVNFEKEIIYIYDTFKRNEMSNREIADMLIEKGLRKKDIYADSAEPKTIKSLQEKGLEYVVGVKKPNVVDSLKFVRGFKIIVNSDCIDIIEEFENYTWKLKAGTTNEYIDEPDDKSYHPHIIHALRYALAKDMIGTAKAHQRLY